MKPLLVGERALVRKSAQLEQVAEVLGTPTPLKPNANHHD